MLGPAPVQHEAITIDPDYTNRAGYAADFLGVNLPMPEPVGALASAISSELRYHHFSIRMHRQRRLALFTAVNIDGSQPVRPPRESDKWILDPRLSADEQVGEGLYAGNDLDRGHLVRRLDPAWGPMSKAANDDTFHFTNCTPQHHLFNAGSTLWLGLEDYVLNNAENHRLAVSVFAGPVLAADDSIYRDVPLPRQFWKMIAMVKPDGQLSVTAYLLSQAHLLDEFRTGREGFGREAFVYGEYRTFQLPVRRIGDLTGLVVTPYVAADPLEHVESLAAPREILRRGRSRALTPIHSNQGGTVMTSTEPTGRLCGAMEIHRRLLTESESYRIARAELETATMGFSALEVDETVVARVPVVVHVVHANDQQNISDAQVHSQIAVLNEDFRATNADTETVPAVFADLVHDARVEFVLADVDPDGRPTTGITRTRNAGAHLRHRRRA